MYGNHILDQLRSTRAKKTLLSNIRETMYIVAANEADKIQPFDPGGQTVSTSSLSPPGCQKNQIR